MAGSNVDRPDVVSCLRIRIYHLTLAAVRQQREAAQLLAENLQSMPEDMLRYKRLTKCRDRIVELLS